MISAAFLSSGHCDACGCHSSMGLLVVSTPTQGEKQYCGDCLDHLSEAIELLDSPEMGCNYDPSWETVPSDDWPMALPTISGHASPC